MNKAAQALGRLGGMAGTGKAKARTTEQARAAALIGWQKRRRYKLCPECGQPMLRKGQKRQNPDDYRHARGCPNDPVTRWNRRQPNSALCDGAKGNYEKHK